MSEPDQAKTIAMGLLGAAIGGCAGYFAFFWIVAQGFYALIVPPTLLGLMAGVFARRRSTILAVICGVAGLLLGLFTQWRFAPFRADESLSYFVTHLHLLRPVTMIMVALGALFSFRFALGRDSASQPTDKPAAVD